jgi:cysteine desulfurase/selenocysteine lyase
MISKPADHIMWLSDIPTANAAQTMHPEFPQSEHVLHLNHAGVGPWPKRTVEAVTRFAHENMAVGSLHYRRWTEVEDALREQLRRLINADSQDDIALLKSTSEAISVVAYGIRWREGENIVIPRGEFPSNRIAWESLQHRYGVTLRQIGLSAANTPEEALIGHLDAHTRLLAVSSVQYATGLRLDLRRIGQACRERGILLCVDAIQSLGAVPFDVREAHADFVVADGHKWMLGPEGVALFYCHPRHREALRLHQFGWHMVQHVGDYERPDWAPAGDGRRFECGSPNSLGVHALHASLSLILEQGLEDISRQISDKIESLADALGCMGFELITPLARERRAGIITFRHPLKDNNRIHARLQEQGVLCAHRAGGIRFSPHFYTPRSVLGRAMDTLRQTLDIV